jgi:hypothetical protein
MMSRRHSLRSPFGLAVLILFTAATAGTACQEQGPPGNVGDGGTTPDSGSGPDGAQTCDFTAKYEYGYIGGFVAFVDRSSLAPGNKYTHSRMGVRGGAASMSCAPPMPSCGAQDIVTAYDIEVHDLGRADVKAALAESTPPLFGNDTRPVDGSVFEFTRADGRGFLVGNDCAGGPAACRPIPAGIAQLKMRLLDLDRQQLAAPDCQGFARP